MTASVALLCSWRSCSEYLATRRIVERLSVPSAARLCKSSGMVCEESRVSMLVSSQSLWRRIAWLYGQAMTVDLRTAHMLVTNALDEEADGGANDIINGRAGAIVALLSLSRIPGWSFCLDVATRVGQQLCLAIRDDSNAKAATIPLGTGLSHGAAGVGLALCELYRETSDPTFREHSDLAFFYEDTHFDERAGNWADIRPDADHEDSATPRFRSTWCYGAPGIALSRLNSAQTNSSLREICGCGSCRAHNDL